VVACEECGTEYEVVGVGAARGWCASAMNSMRMMNFNEEEEEEE